MSLSSFDTIWPADSVEFCPHPNATHMFVCGTYNLEKPDHSGQLEEDATLVDGRAKQTRRGKCLLFSIENEDDPSLVQETPLPAVLDMKWCHREPSVNPVLGIADSEGHVTLHEYDLGSTHLNQTQRISVAGSEVLVLSLDWSNRRHSNSDLGNMVVSLSDGSLALLRQGQDRGLSVTDTWHAHDYEPWIAAWNYWDTNIVYSGGDDLTMRGWDIRAGFSQATFTNKKFDAGVTTIQSHPFIEHLMAVGSYDNTVRLFDARNPMKPLTQADVGGGAWRVKWHPSATRKNDLLVACMHDGCKILRFDLGGEGPLQVDSHSVSRRFDKHESMAYGADWSFSSSTTEDTLVASCSFYDHLLQMWRG